MRHRVPLHAATSGNFISDVSVKHYGPILKVQELKKEKSAGFSYFAEEA
jgi:hypothetical protein